MCEKAQLTGYEIPYRQEENAKIHTYNVYSQL